MSSRMSDKSIWVTFEKIGYHCYPEAKTAENLKDVNFLGDLHRHKFFFRVEVPVKHTNRDIEFFQFQKMLISWYDERELQLDSKSCEMLAEELANKILDNYDVIWAAVSVAEDNENGSEVIVYQ